MRYRLPSQACEHVSAAAREARRSPSTFANSCNTRRGWRVWPGHQNGVVGRGVVVEQVAQIENVALAHRTRPLLCEFAKRYRLRLADDEAALTADIIRLASQFGRYGYRRITALLHIEGWHVNHKRVERIWRREGLKVPAKQAKRRRLWLNDGSCIGLRPCWRNHIWSYDFVQARTHDGRVFRMLTVIDEYSRECLAILVARRLRSDDVLHLLTDWFTDRGPPDHIRSDNGSGFRQRRSAHGWLGSVSGHWRKRLQRELKRKPRDELLNGEISLWLNDGSCIGLRPCWRNHIWSYDFVQARTHDGRVFRMLTVIDEYSRECLAILVARRLRSDDVLHLLTDWFTDRGPPDHIRSDNGSGFTAKAVRSWLARIGVRTLFIAPGSPWENGYNESLNGKPRDELLNGEIFYDLREAKVLIERWRRHYNTIRPHSALGYRPPAPATIITIGPFRPALLMGSSPIGPSQPRGKL